MLTTQDTAQRTSTLSQMIWHSPTMEDSCSSCVMKIGIPAHWIQSLMSPVTTSPTRVPCPWMPETSGFATNAETAMRKTPGKKPNTPDSDTPVMPKTVSATAALPDTITKQSRIELASSTAKPKSPSVRLCWQPAKDVCRSGLNSITAPSRKQLI